jgi:V/A-type H+-transporting ATPase subunit I
MDNPGAIKPMELLTRTNGLPSYTEFDPTVFVFLTFPVFFGFMIGDLGYGLLYIGIGAVLYRRFDNAAIAALGGIAIWSGVFTMVFGVLYGEFFGLHALGDIVWGGSSPIHKGLQPHYQMWAKAWLVVSLAVGLLHVTVGHLLGFAKITINHDLREAVFEKGSWVLLLVGIWVMIFSRFGAGMKPDFLFTAFATEGAQVPGTDLVAEGALAPALELGFTGLPASVGIPALALVGVGFVMLIVGEGMLAIEVLQSIVNVLSYARLMAVLLAKAGMAFVVNLLVFGAYETTPAYDGEAGEFHFIFVEGGKIPEVGADVMFPGLFNLGDGAALVIGFVAGVVLLVVGHLFVLALGVTSAGLQAIRLEYVEFFGKFYDGGGRTYNPFGYSREHTTED